MLQQIRLKYDKKCFDKSDHAQKAETLDVRVLTQTGSAVAVEIGKYSSHVSKL